MATATANMIHGMTITKRDESKGGPAYLLSRHCGAVYALYRMPADVDASVMSVEEVNPGKFPVLNCRRDKFTDRGGILRLIGRTGG